MVLGIGLDIITDLQIEFCCFWGRRSLEISSSFSLCSPFPFGPSTADPHGEGGVGGAAVPHFPLM